MSGVLRSARNLALAAVGLAVVVGIATPSTTHGGVGIAHVMAHGQVVWVLERSETGEVLYANPGRIDITALDTDTTTPWCPVVECGPSDDRIRAVFKDWLAIDTDEGNVQMSSFFPDTA